MGRDFDWFMVVMFLPLVHLSGEFVGTESDGRFLCWCAILYVAGAERLPCSAPDCAKLLLLLVLSRFLRARMNAK
jgi:hypothetical protein